MSARRPKAARQWRRDSKRIRVAEERARLALLRSMRATEEYVPVRNHRVPALRIRMSDMVLGEGPYLFPLPFDGGPAGFMHGFRHWPSGEFDPEAQKIVVRDWSERALYSQVKI